MLEVEGKEMFIDYVSQIQLYNSRIVDECQLIIGVNLENFIKVV